MLNIEEIKQIIPHREPFLLIDGAEIIEPERSVKGFKKLTGDEDFFRGHFPDEPVMPGVLIIESLAQLGAVLGLSVEKYKGKKMYFTSVNNAKFRRKVVPGDTLDLFIEFISFRHSIGCCRAAASVKGVEVCSAELGFVFG
ncbi:3-hydroxyacyl-ACP dehydratase FabZ [bacterium]|nr:3-hydroxyacyl-ACP dehydratase FabZ [bacterium]